MRCVSDFKDGKEAGSDYNSAFGVVETGFSSEEGGEIDSGFDNIASVSSKITIGAASP